MFKQPAKPSLAFHFIWVNIQFRRRWGLQGDQRPIPQPLVWPEPVVIEHIGLDDMVQLPKAEAEQEVWYSRLR